MVDPTIAPFRAIPREENRPLLPWRSGLASGLFHDVEASAIDVAARTARLIFHSLFFRVSSAEAEVVRKERRRTALKNC
jgi:hypothetical protein